MSTRRLVILITFTSIFAMAARIVVETDLFWHIATGKYILETRSVPLSDIFSHTRFDSPWKGASISWIMQAILFMIYNLFSFGGLHIWTALLVVAEFALLYRSLSGGVFLRAFTLILAAATAGVYWSARPYMISFIFVAITLGILEDYRWRNKNRLWLLPILMVIWVNSHGGFIYGFIIWGLYGLAEGMVWLGQAWKENKLAINKEWVHTGLKGRVGYMLLIGFLMIMATTINPSGTEMLLYPYETIVVDAAKNLIDEWQSPNFHELQIQPYLLLLILTIGAVGVNPRSISWSDFFLLTGSIYMSLIYQRNIAIFALTAPIILTRAAAPLTKRIGTALNYHGLPNSKPNKRINILNWVLAILLTSMAVYKASIVLPSEINQQVISQTMPNGAVEIINQSQPKGNILNEYNWGGYLILTLPQYPVFIDGRADLYGDEIIGEWISIILAEDGWQDKLDQWDINLILLEPTRPIILELEQNGWQLLYQDEISVAYTR